MHANATYRIGRATGLLLHRCSSSGTNLKGKGQKEKTFEGGETGEDPINGFVMRSTHACMHERHVNKHYIWYVLQ